jgi:hypothetical protein
LLCKERAKINTIILIILQKRIELKKKPNIYRVDEIRVINWFLQKQKKSGKKRICKYKKLEILFRNESLSIYSIAFFFTYEYNEKT